MIDLPPHDDTHWMQLALTQARLAADAGEVPVGAVVVKDGRLLATGRNAPIASHDPTAHAEMVALRAAAQALGNYRLDGCTLYVTLEPCAMCSGAMLHARLARVVFGAADAKTGAAGGVLNVFQLGALNHQTQVSGGVLADDAAQVLQSFFKARRGNPQPLRDDALRTPTARFAGLHHPALRAHTVVLGDQTPWPGLRVQVTDTTPDTGCEGGTPAGSDAERGRADGVCVLHGPWGWARDAEGLALALQAQGTRAVLPDLPGFGRSDKPKKPAAHTVERHRDTVRALAQQLHLRRVVWLVPGVPSALALAQALSEADPGALGRVVVWWPHAAGAAACPTQDAPFPDAGHRAAQRAWARWTAPTGLPSTWHRVWLRGAMADWAAPVWAHWGGAWALPDNPASVHDEAGLARVLAGL